MYFILCAWATLSTQGYVSVGQAENVDYVSNINVIITSSQNTANANGC